MVKRKRLLSNADKDDKVEEDSRNDLSMESCEVLVDSVTLPSSSNSSTSIVFSATAPDSVVSTAGNRARARSHSIVDTAGLTSAGQDVDVDLETNTAALQAVSHHITTRSATGRLAKRPKRDPSPPLSPPRKLVKDSLAPISVETTPQQVHHRKQWSIKLKNLFFAGLFEHGKDFDAIQNLFVQKHKRLGDSDTPMKTKDQIRHFYYRTWNKMSGYIDRSGIEDANKQALELFGLICYNELRRKSGAKFDDKKGQKLNELIYKGSTTLKVRGKNCRLKVPTCRALKKLINVDEMKEREESRLEIPERITVELRPRTKSAWAHVQSMSKNPRLLVRLPADKHLSFVIDLLAQKWQPNKDEISSSIASSTGSQELTLYVPSGCTLSPVSFRPIQAQSKVDLSFTKYLANFRNQFASAGTTNSPQNKRSAAKLLAISKTEDNLSSSKLKSAETRPAVIDLKPVLNNSAAAFNGIGTVDACEMLWEASGRVSDNVGSSELLQLVEGTTCLTRTNAADSLRLEDYPVVSDGKVPEQHVSVCSGSNPPSDVSIEKINRLKKPLDRTTAQMYTFAELYLLMSRPERVPLEYDWNMPQSNNDSAAAAADSLMKQISMRLRKLIDVAASEFVLTKLQMSVGDNGSQSVVTSGGMLRIADFTRSPRGRNENAATGKHISRSPLSVGKTRRDGMMIGNVAEAHLDQSANYSWPTALCDGSVQTECNTSVSDTSAVTSLGIGSSNGVIPIGGESVIFRVPTSFPPRVNAGKAGVAMLPGSFSDRKIVDQNLLEQQHADLLMPKGRSRKLSRNVRKPLVQRTLLPKSQTSTGQIVAVAMVPGDASSLVSNTPPFLTSLSSSARGLPAMAVSDASRPSVITMAPTEIRVRRIVPTPVAVPCNSSPAFGQDIVAMCSSSLTSGTSTQQSLISGSMSMQGQRTSSEHTSHIPNAITGVDAFLQEPLHAGTRITDSSISSSFLCGADSNSMLDISLPIPEASDMSDKLLDIALANSNGSFPGLLDSNSSSANGRDKDSAMASGVANHSSFSNNGKNFKGAISRMQQQEDAWLSADVAMDLSLSGYINESPMKKFLTEAVANGSNSFASRVPTSRICSLAAYTAGICGENSRDSVDTSMQCMMNENSYELTSNFFNMVREKQETDTSASLLATPNISHSTTYS